MPRTDGLFLSRNSFTMMGSGSMMLSVADCNTLGLFPSWARQACSSPHHLLSYSVDDPAFILFLASKH